MFHGHCACGNCEGVNVLYEGATANEVLDQFDQLTEDLVEQKRTLAHQFGMGDKFDESGAADTLRAQINSVPVRIVEVDQNGVELTSETGTPATLRLVYAAA